MESATQTAPQLNPQLKTLTPEQVEQFITDGYLLLKEAFPRAVADAVLPIIWSEAPINPDDRATWERKRYVVQKSLTGDAVNELYTDRVRGAIDDLVGEGRYKLHCGTGYVLLGLPGFAEPPWQPPTVGWHIDGIHFHHHLNSREQGLVGLFLYTDIEHGGGGTAIRPGSHHITARILRDAEPDGMTLQELCHAVAEQTQHLPVVEVTGRGGDLVLMHPHTYHASSDNCSERIRIASNICITLHEPMNFTRPDPSDHSPVEQAVIEACQGGGGGGGGS